jgi:hypothetical protein
MTRAPLCTRGKTCLQAWAHGRHSARRNNPTRLPDEAPLPSRRRRPTLRTAPTLPCCTVKRMAASMLRKAPAIARRWATSVLVARGIDVHKTAGRERAASKRCTLLPEQGGCAHQSTTAGRCVLAGILAPSCCASASSAPRQAGWAAPCMHAPKQRASRAALQLRSQPAASTHICG